MKNSTSKKTQNRREFLKKTAAGISVAAITSNSFSNNLFHEAPFEKKSLDVIKGPETLKVKVEAPLFCPYFNPPVADNRGGTHYWKSDGFTDNPFTVVAAGTSGSPVIIDKDGNFWGFMTTMGHEKSTFSFDGKETLTIEIPEGQILFSDTRGRGDDAWKDYNSSMMKRLNFNPLTVYPHFWADVEYCTWVEQIQLSNQVNKEIPQFNILNHQMVKTYLDKIIELGYPKGKLTLDHGWGIFPDGHLNSGFGSWEPDPAKFPDFRKTMDMIREKGFTPGLWIGFPKIHKASTKAAEYPEMLGKPGGLWPDRSTDMQWLNPHADIFEYASEVINRFYKMGVMKFKIDMSYNYKIDMLPIHKELYHAAKCIDKDIEMEFHVPDIFFTKFTDTIRTNDVWLRDDLDWQLRVKSHYEICLKSSPGRGINLDHIGGNDPSVLTEEKYLEHLSMYKNSVGYPLVSVLPHHISGKCVDETGDYLWNYERGERKIISDFYN